MVPKLAQRAVWAHYRDGQCDDKEPSENWHIAADAAIGLVAIKENRGLTRAQCSAVDAYNAIAKKNE